MPDIGAAVEALAARGVRFTVCPGFGRDARGIRAATEGSVRLDWFPDPDGNVLSLAQTA